MEHEIELKLLLPPTASLQPVIDTLAELNCGTNPSHSELYNAYFDTADGQLRAMGMGFRVRSDGERIEQTLKTQGRSEAGLHQRPEFNLPLDSLEPDLNKFQQVPWPVGVQVGALNTQLEEVFTTHFNRHRVDVDTEGASVEVVLDSGEVRAGKYSEPIFEMELELKNGNIAALFALADTMVNRHQLRLGNQSKAARGYQLAGQRSARPSHSLDVISANAQMTIEQAFSSSASRLLDFWQEQEEAYCQMGKNRYLFGIYQAMVSVRQLVDLYRGVLVCPEMEQQYQRITALCDRWHWVPLLTNLRELKSHKGPYRKLLEKSDDFLAFLQGRIDGLIGDNDPLNSIYAEDYSTAKLGLLSLLTLQPWGPDADEARHPVLTCAATWLTRGWEEIKAQLTNAEDEPMKSYVRCEPVLRRTLNNGLLLSGFFDKESRIEFRRPWLDLFEGMQELSVLNLLEQAVTEADLRDSEERRDILAWCQRKRMQLLVVMAQSRVGALKLKPYW